MIFLYLLHGSNHHSDVIVTLSYSPYFHLNMENNLPSIRTQLKLTQASFTLVISSISYSCKIPMRSMTPSFTLSHILYMRLRWRNHKIWLQSILTHMNTNIQIKSILNYKRGSCFVVFTVTLGVTALWDTLSLTAHCKRFMRHTWSLDSLFSTNMKLSRKSWSSMSVMIVY